MNASSRHQEMKEMLPAAALDILAGPDLQAVLGHVRECEECTRLLSEYRDVAAALPLLLPERGTDPARSHALRDRLLARARQKPLAAPRPSQALPRASQAILVAERWSGWMVAAGLAGLLVTHHAFHRPLEFGWIVAAVLAVALVIVGLYARIQRKRVSALLKRLGEADQGGH